MSQSLPPSLPPASQQPQVIPYAQPVPIRPGLLTAIGIASIVIGSFGILGSICSAGQSFAYMAIRSVPFPPPTPGGSPAGGAQVGLAMSPGIAPFAQMSIVPLIIGICTSIAGLGLAIYLLIAGILVMRDSISARTHHIRYALMKSFVAVVEGLAFGWTLYEMTTIATSAARSAGAGTPPYSTAGVGLAGSAMLAGMGLIYPVLLLILLNLPQIRHYYQGARG